MTGDKLLQDSINVCINFNFRCSSKCICKIYKNSQTSVLSKSDLTEIFGLLFDDKKSWLYITQKNCRIQIFNNNKSTGLKRTELISSLGKK